jgi:hypothetical protein
MTLEASNLVAFLVASAWVCIFIGAGVLLRMLVQRMADQGRPRHTKGLASDRRLRDRTKAGDSR